MHFDYTMLPDVGDTSILELDLGFAQQLLNGTNTLLVYANYVKSDYDYFNSHASRPSEEVDRTHQFKLGIDYTLFLGRFYNLNFAFVPTISTTWNSSLVGDDFFWNYSFRLVKTWIGKSGSSTLKAGILRTPLFGRPELVPTFSFLKEWGNHWFLELGFPSNSLRAQLNERHGIGLDFSFVGTYTNLSNPIFVDSFDSIEAVGLVQNGRDLSLNHTYRLQKNFTTTVKVGYQFIDDFELQDVSENQVYDFGGDASVQFSLGIMYNFK